ncbi:hypothetical protein BT69DRAFT_758055 [Atractiella rhizophila]|nr:hypothetical protein BT69DRAFT_758055 [Atractiella rhizophila]
MHFSILLAVAAFASAAQINKSLFPKGALDKTTVIPNVHLGPVNFTNSRPQDERLQPTKTVQSQTYSHFVAVNVTSARGGRLLQPIAHSGNVKAGSLKGEVGSRGGILLRPVHWTASPQQFQKSTTLVGEEQAPRGGILLHESTTLALVPDTQLAADSSEEYQKATTLVEGDQSVRGGKLLIESSSIIPVEGTKSAIIPSEEQLLSSIANKEEGEDVMKLVPVGEESSRGGILLDSVTVPEDSQELGQKLVPESFSSNTVHGESEEASKKFVPVGQESPRGGTLVTAVSSTTIAPPSVVSNTSISTLADYEAAGGITDSQILNFALSLEYLEHSFYTQALKKFSANAFAQGGYKSSVRRKLQTMHREEGEHIEFLKGILGSDALKPCTYKFNIKDVKQVMTLNRIFTGVGVSAYITSSALLDAHAYVRAAASILSVEARQASWSANLIDGEAFPTGFDSALSLAGVASLAKSFVVNCPKENASKIGNITKGSSAWKTLTVKGKTVAGEKTELVFDRKMGKPYWAAWIHEMSVDFTKINARGETVIPNGLKGQVYVAITKNRDERIRDSDVLAGLAVVDL